MSEEPVITHLEFNEPRTLEIVKSIADEPVASASEFQPKTITQLAEQSSASEFLKTADYERAEKMDDLIDVFDLGGAKDNDDKPSKKGAVDDMLANADFLLNIQDL